MNIARDVEDRRELLVDAIALGLQVHQVALLAHHIVPVSTVHGGAAVRLELIAEGITREGQGTASVFLLGLADEVGAEANLRLHLFLAVTVIIVGNQGHHHAIGIATGDLEGLTFVVALVFVLPAHAIANLARCGGAAVGQTEVLFAARGQVRSQDQTARSAGPMVRIQGGIIVGQVGIAGVTENRFDEVEIADQGAGGEQADFHRLLGRGARAGGNRRPHQGTNQQRHKAVGRLGAGAGVGQQQVGLGRLDRRLQQARKGRLRHRLLIAGNRQAALGDMERPGGGPAVALGIVQHALGDAVGRQQRRVNLVLVRRQGQQPGHAGAVEHEVVPREFDRPGLGRHVGEMPVEEVLQTPIRRTQVARQQAGLLAVGLNQIASHRQQIRRRTRRREAVGGQLEFEVLDEVVVVHGHDLLLDILIQLFKFNLLTLASVGEHRRDRNATRKGSCSGNEHQHATLTQHPTTTYVLSDCKIGHQ